MYLNRMCLDSPTQPSSCEIGGAVWGGDAIREVAQKLGEGGFIRIIAFIKVAVQRPGYTRFQNLYRQPLGRFTALVAALLEHLFDQRWPQAQIGNFCRFVLETLGYGDEIAGATLPPAEFRLDPRPELTVRERLLDLDQFPADLENIDQMPRY